MQTRACDHWAWASKSTCSSSCSPGNIIYVDLFDTLNLYIIDNLVHYPVFPIGLSQAVLRALYAYFADRPLKEIPHIEVTTCVQSYCMFESLVLVLRTHVYVYVCVRVCACVFRWSLVYWRRFTLHGCSFLVGIIYLFSYWGIRMIREDFNQLLISRFSTKGFVRKTLYLISSWYLKFLICINSMPNFEKFSW